MAQVAGIVAYLTATAAAIPEPTPLPPTAPWVVEYASNMCVLSRGFGGTVKVPKASLALRPVPLSTRGEMVVATSDVASEPSRRGKVTVTSLPSGQRQQVPFGRRWDAQARRALMSFDVSSDFLLSLRDADAIDIAAGREPPMRLATGKTAKALDALAPCQDDLLKTWGYDPAIKGKIGKPAALSAKTITAYFSREFYPAEAVRAEQEGRTTVAWTIGADGRTKDCRVVASSGVKSLDLQTCAIILQKVRYSPALDRSGQPMATYGIQSVNWSLEY